MEMETAGLVATRDSVCFDLRPLSCCSSCWRLSSSMGSPMTSIPLEPWQVPCLSPLALRQVFDGQRIKATSMNDAIDYEVRLALAVSVIAATIWVVLLVRMVLAMKLGRERRPYILAMPMVGLLASIGTLASAIGFGIQTGVLEVDISGEALTLVASMGRGALLMGGVVALGYYHPHNGHEK